MEFSPPPGSVCRGTPSLSLRLRRGAIRREAGLVRVLFGFCSAFVRCLLGSVRMPAGPGSGQRAPSISGHFLARESGLPIRTAAEPHSRHCLCRNGSPRMPSHAVDTTGACWMFSDRSAVRLGSETQYLGAALRVIAEWRQSGSLAPVCLQSGSTCRSSYRGSGSKAETKRIKVSTPKTSISSEYEVLGGPRDSALPPCFSQVLTWAEHEA